MRQTPIDVAAITVFLLVVVVIAVKALTGRGTPLRGGLPSGHAAVAFGGWVAITFIAAGTAFDLPISVIALVMAFLTAQSRVQAGIHTWLEVALGGLLGAGLTVLIFRRSTRSTDGRRGDAVAEIMTGRAPGAAELALAPCAGRGRARLRAYSALQ